MKMGIWLAVGIRVGAAIRAGTHQLAVGIGMGVAIGLLVGSFASRNSHYGEPTLPRLFLYAKSLFFGHAR